jgi:hypothetical protein
VLLVFAEERRDTILRLVPPLRGKGEQVTTNAEVREMSNEEMQARWAEFVASQGSTECV